MTTGGDAVLSPLATKLHAPRRRQGVVARPRLRQLEQRGQPRLTLVSAPAGYAKSTLVAELFADGATTAWLSLDGRADEPLGSGPTSSPRSVPSSPRSVPMRTRSWTPASSIPTSSSRRC